MNRGAALSAAERQPHQIPLPVVHRSAVLAGRALRRRTVDPIPLRDLERAPLVPVIAAPVSLLRAGISQLALWGSSVGRDDRLG